MPALTNARKFDDTKSLSDMVFATAKVSFAVAVIICMVVYGFEAVRTLNGNQAHISAYLSRPAPDPRVDELSQWMQHCDYVYLDVGSNIGVQIRKLFEPDLFPGAPVLEVFDAVFGTDRQNRTDVCAVGFEPNVHHSQRLKALEEAYNHKGWRVRIFTETAVSTEDGTAEFFFDSIAATEHQSGGPLSSHGRVTCKIRRRLDESQQCALWTWRNSCAPTSQRARQLQ